ncbi:alpha-L-glutamate ligase [Neobacillus sp. PS3-12]|uniref:alpha-L-glutamate ligase n=1 Tax=Neobacillus sp. PS3-12 TaxID=3070677 RepID=UPI0027E0FB2C|nr:alpha-L-glutamate ligase [Neobacillus sp. PS3-12]WML52606.1 alpha-L-glutamate ligase [Neobacillus sp. PS3-12]
MSKIYIIHENDDWTRHLIKRLDELSLPFEAWHLDKGIVDLTTEPPEGVFYNRMSASSHTRDHRYAPELTSGILAWLEFHERTVFNGSRALSLELSKIITLIQEYIQSPESFITRVEFIGGKYFYAVRVDTSEGFQLCPADSCQIGDLFCPVGEESEAKPKFEIIEDVDPSLIERYEAFLQANKIDVAGIEFIRDQNDKIYTYDVNTNTNYNSEAEEKAGKYGMLELAKLLGKALADIHKC